MEALPEEIADKIFDLVFEENSKNLYLLRLVSKTWKNMIDRCGARLLKVWCKQCSEEIPEDCLNELVRRRLPQSWQEYCSSSELALPHIAKDIHDSMQNELLNLKPNRVFFTEIGSPFNIEHKSISCYAVNDEYFAMSFQMRQGGKQKYALRIYLLDDLTHCIKEYPILCKRIDFYTTNKQVFIVFEKYNIDRKICSSNFLADFADGNVIHLISANHLSLNGKFDYVITNNHCFTFTNFPSVEFYHHQLTSKGCRSSSVTSVPFIPNYGWSKITNIQICDSNLFVFMPCGNFDTNAKYSIAVYKYQITQQPDNKLIFSDPIVYIKNIAKGMLIKFGADNIPSRNSICDFDSRKFNSWISTFFQTCHVRSVSIYVYHILITCLDKFIVFRGNPRQLMDYAARNADPGFRFTVIDLKSSIRMLPLNHDYVRAIHIKSKPRFLIVTKSGAFICQSHPK